MSYLNRLLGSCLLLTLFCVDSSAQEVAGQARSAAAEVRSTSYQGEPITLDLVDVSLVDFFRTISELSGLNILIDPDVKGTITIHVEEVPWDQVFEMVLKSHNLERSIQGNMVRISTKTTLRKEEEAKEALKRAEFQAADTLTVTRHLNYAIAKDIAAAIEKQLTTRGQINVDSRTNTLIMTDVAPSIQRISALLDTLDSPERQVEIEARIIEATTTFARELGSQLAVEIGKPSDRNQGRASVIATFDDPVVLANFTTGKLLDTFRLDAIIGAAETRGDARILSKPRVSAQNNAQAVITQGAKIPIPVQQNFTTTVRFETAALQLTVTPQITEQGTVMLTIRLENNIPDFSRTVLGIPTILTSESQTRVLVPDGGTTVIGGIFVETDRRQENKVPGLGDVPVLGHLFKNTRKDRETREILFFITPRIKS
ncbi:MAG: secretin and TonB N-terminal domain-containing protein [Acidobacteria bacterium]|nr:secretin and TonB N-terminal domain-containing protein [Acidobacteriota bacterium]